MMLKELNKNERFNNSDNFAVYYGRGNVDELSKYDIVILESKAYSAEEIKQIKASGTLVIAYVSVLEVNESSPGYNLLKKDDFCFVGGKILRNDEFNNAIVKLYSKRWYSILINHIGNLLLNEGYDGIFLDTIGDLEYFKFPDDIYQNTCNYLFKFIEEIRNLFKDYIIIQNNGIEKIYTITAQFLDGICWENPPASRAVQRHLMHIREITDLKIFIILTNTNKYIEKMAKHNLFALYQCNENYLEIK